MADQAHIDALVLRVLPRRYRRLPGSHGQVAVMFVAVGVIAVALIAVIAFGVLLLTGLPLIEALEGAAWAGLGGLMFALFGAVLLPMIRDALGLTEDIRLLEAASAAHPLLRRLMVEAPGTYTHSVSVANLAEAAAERLDADQLLARVASYYHDVGKVKRPCYFFENQAEGENPHDEAHPALSAVIITAHVADGVELAEEYKLPAKISTIIDEHHGDSLVRYFYHKASAHDASVYEADFRYRGHKPSSKESALVMLADGCEAAVRALAKPSAPRVEEAVRDVVSERLADGQLDDAGLSAGDLDAIISVYSRMLTSMYHSRCAYPRNPVERKPA
jgi:putative nucleotidyltransferase with HDIG domain